MRANKHHGTSRRRHVFGGTSAGWTVCALLVLASALGACRGRDMRTPPPPNVGGLSGLGPGIPRGTEFGYSEPARLAEFLGPTDWAGRLERDARLDMTGSGARNAADDLESRVIDWGEVDRASALFALGWAGSEGELARLMAWSIEGTPLERKAAVLALGELQSSDAAYFESLLEGPDAGVSRCALFALGRSGSTTGRRRLQSIATLRDSPLAMEARAVLAFLDEPTAGESSGAAKLFLDLRWESARRYGLVDGQSFSVLVARELVKDSSFLDAVILIPAAELSYPGVQDHLMDHLLTVGGTSAVRASVRCMPEALSRLVRSGLWLPDSVEQWRALVEEIGEQDRALESLDVLLIAAQIPEVRGGAAVLLLGAGVDDAYALIEDDVTALEPQRRVLVAEALGNSGDERFSSELVRMRFDTDPRVKSAALIGLVRLGDTEAINEMRRVLAEGEPNERSRLVQAMARASYDRRMLGWFDQALAALEPGSDDALLLATHLSLRGRLGHRTEVVEALEVGRGGSLRVLMVRALSRGANERELEALRRQFPDPLDMQLNIEVGLALVRNRDPVGRLFMRQALWSAPWNRSVLAAALVVDQQGLHGLVEELNTPPSRVSDNDLRRIGFALGEFGGVDQVESLARRRSSGDPVLQGAYLGALGVRTQ